MTIGYSLHMSARHVDSNNPGPSNLVFRSKPIPEAEMSNRLNISRFDMSCAQVHRVRWKPIGLLRVMQLKLHKPTMAIGHSLRMCARLADSPNPGRCNKLFRSKPIRKPRCRIGLLRTVMGIGIVFKHCFKCYLRIVVAFKILLNCSIYASS